MAQGTEDSSDWPPRMVVAVGAVVLKGRRALLVRQAKGHSLQGQWTVPWGIVDPGETPDTAALRETLEEGGVTAQIEGLLGIQNLRGGWLGVAFLCRHVSGAPEPDGGIETDRAAYLSVDELDALGEPLEPWSEWLVRRVLRGEHNLTLPEPDNPLRPGLAFL